MAEIVDRNVKDLGFDIQTRVGQYTSQQSQVINDERAFHFWLTSYSPNPGRLDPNEFLLRVTVDNAGANGQPNPTNYANCEYTTLAKQQQNAASTEERHELVNRAQQVHAEDWAVIPMAHWLVAGAARSDLNDLGPLGSAQIAHYNHEFQILSTPREDDEFIIGTRGDMILENLNWLTTAGTVSDYVWNTVPNSPLIDYTPDFELRPMLAESYDISNEGRTVEVVLKSGAEFHNGEPITAEDAAFTMQHIEDNIGRYPMKSEMGYSSIDVSGDRTVTFEFDSPNPPFITTHLPKTGIVHRATWEEMGAADDPSNFDMTDENFVGSGPYRITNHEPTTRVIMEPHDGHPHYSGLTGNLLWLAFDDPQARTTAMINGEIDAGWSMSAGEIRRLRAELSEDQLTAAVGPGFTPNILAPQCSYGPTKFPEFRHAIGKAIDRQQINTVSYNGASRPFMACTWFSSDHPWRAPDEMLNFFTDDPTGDIEGARQVLRDAGWGQDGQGNWHYPPGADLSPLWPQGETPSASDFPCLDG